MLVEYGKLGVYWSNLGFSVQEMEADLPNMCRLAARRSIGRSFK